MSASNHKQEKKTTLTRKADARPEFKDASRPLNCGDDEVHKQISARILDKIKSRKNKMRANGEKPITLATIGDEWGCSEQNVSKRIRRPQTLKSYNVVTLCDMLHVSLDYLQYGGTNGYGRYESTDFMADVIERLDPNDKETVWRVLESVASKPRETSDGKERESILEEVTRERKDWLWLQWMELHPEETKATADKLRESIDRVTAYALSGFTVKLPEATSQVLADIAANGIGQALAVTVPTPPIPENLMRQIADIGGVAAAYTVPPEKTEQVRRALEAFGREAERRKGEYPEE